MTPDSILSFWFGDSALALSSLDQRISLWFGKSEATDATIRERFGAAIEAASRRELDHFADSPRGRLALLVLLDQFPRNIHRGTPGAFANDARALSIALEGIEKGHDRELHPVQRLFFYLPLEHAEDLAMQERAVELCRALHNEAPPGWDRYFANFLDYAERHRDVIAKFGRFPHRNAILGRESTEAEREYLAQPGAGF